MLRRLVLNCLVGGMLCCAGSIQAVVWDRRFVAAGLSREERLPDQTPAEGPGEDDLRPALYQVKAPPIPKPPIVPRPAPKPQPTPRPTPLPPGATPTPPRATPTPPVTKPS